MQTPQPHSTNPSAAAAVRQMTSNLAKLLEAASKQSVPFHVRPAPMPQSTREAA
jgi:hypothetical protein